jgi:hypothetical protein
MQGRALCIGGQVGLGRMPCKFKRPLIPKRSPVGFSAKRAVYAEDRDVATDPYQLATARLQTLLTDSR